MREMATERERDKVSVRVNKSGRERLWERELQRERDVVREGVR